MNSPQYVQKHWEHISKQIIHTIKSHHRIFLFLDYDGTLVSIKKTPALAVLSLSMTKLLKRLSSIKYTSLIIVTGRSYSDIKKLVRLKNVIIASNHGFQISSGKNKWIHPDVKQFLPLLKKILQSLKEALKKFPLTLIENKNITLTIHFRNVQNQSIPAIKKIISSTVQEYYSKFRTTTGKKIIEIRPNVVWDKGRAVLKVLTMLRSKKNKDTIVYIGDDKTDEDAFKVLQGVAITIRVGRSSNTHAEYYVRNPLEVQEFLEKVELVYRKRSQL